MKKVHISLLLVIIGVIGAFFLLQDKNTSESKGKSVGEISEENKEKTMIHENGDFVYKPSKDEIGYDEKDEILFYENLLNVILVSEVSNEQAEKIANIVNGNIVGKMQGLINMFQIQVEEKSLTELHQLADQLMEEELVKFAGSSTPSFISDANVNGVSEDIKASLDGSDWWAEAIYAYPAWYYMDHHANKLDPVNLTVVEKGKLGKNDEINDETIDKESVNVSKSSSKKAVYEKMGNSDLSHAELVTKIIAADENSETIRGIAESVAEVEFIAMGNELSEKDTVSEPEIISYIKTSIQKNDLSVINNSWGNPPMSKEKWKEDDWIRNILPEDWGHGLHVDAIRDTNDQVSAQLIIALDEILSSKKSGEFLIIQAAGNGYSRLDDEKWTADTSTKVTDTGFFANINEDTYKLAKNSDDVQLDNELADILDHIIVVGGAVQTGEKDEFESPGWASYGGAIDIAAPAENLFTQPGYSGTSFSAPMVSGAAALIWSYQPKLEASKVKEHLLDRSVYSVEDQRGENAYTYPMLNMASFLDGPFIYHDLIETYEIAINEQWAVEELLENGLWTPSQDPSQTLPEDYGYEFRDINENGFPELVIGMQREDGTSEIYEIYALQNNEPVSVFANGIRTNINIYENNIISESYGMKSMGYYELDKNGAPILEEGYEINGVGEYVDSVNHNKLMTETETNALDEKYHKIDEVEHSFTPFVAPKETAESLEKELENDEMEQIVRENYEALEEILLETSINDLYDKHHKVEEAQRIWKTGVDLHSPFYGDVYELLYPKVKKLVAEEGMESLINEKFSMFWQPPATISFFGPLYELEVLVKNSEYFKVKQTKEIGPQDQSVGDDGYDLIYIIDYLKEDGKWKFAGAEKQE